MSIPSYISESRQTLQDCNQPLAPGLYLVATPIGNLEDITLRALRILRAADLVACEDKRASSRLFARYDLKPKKTSYHDHNAQKARQHLLSILEQGKSVALISDAGTPLISDPGNKLVRACINRNIKVFPIPGPSAVLAAICAAGLPSDRFLFAGFVPSQSRARRIWLTDMKELRASLVLMESPKRLGQCLRDIAEILGQRQAAVMRELTKIHEDARRGQLGDLADFYLASGPPKGEVTIVIGPPIAQPLADDDVDAMIVAALERLSLRDASAEVSMVTGRAKADIYRRALTLSGRQ